MKSIQDTVKVQETELAEFTVRWEARTIRREGGGGHGARMHRWGRGIDSVWSASALGVPLPYASLDLPSPRPMFGTQAKYKIRVVKDDEEDEEEDEKKRPAPSSAAAGAPGVLVGK